MANTFYKSTCAYQKFYSNELDKKIIERVVVVVTNFN